MRGFIKGRRHWVVPTALAAVLVSALFISPAIGGPKFVTGKKVIKTITKKTQASELRVQSTKPAGTGSIDAADAVVATLPLKQGPNIVSSTFSVTRNSAGQVSSCELRIVGGPKDSYGGFHNSGPSQIHEGVALSVSGNAPAGGKAELRCSDFSPVTALDISNIEITSLKVPKLQLTTAP